MSERRFVLADFTYMDRAGVLRAFGGALSELKGRTAPRIELAHAATKRELVAKERRN